MDLKKLPRWVYGGLIGVLVFFLRGFRVVPHLFDSWFLSLHFFLTLVGGFCIGALFFVKLKTWLKGGIIGALLAFLFLVPSTFFHYVLVTLPFLLFGFFVGAISSFIFSKIRRFYWLAGGLIGFFLGLVGPFFYLLIISIPESIRENSNPLQLLQGENAIMIFAFFGLPALIILVILGVTVGIIVGVIKRNQE